jgi:hypothetical protein
MAFKAFEKIAEFSPLYFDGSVLAIRKPIVGGLGLFLRSFLLGLQRNSGEPIGSGEFPRLDEFRGPISGDLPDNYCGNVPPVVRASLWALWGRIVCIPGWGNRLLASALRCAPTATVFRALSRLPLFRRRAGTRERPFS